MDNHVFIIDQLTGVLQTNETYARFADGYFEISVKAMNAPDKNDLMKIKVNSGFIFKNYLIQMVVNANLNDYRRIC